MDLRTGKTYRTKEEALADGVPESDLAFYQLDELGGPIVDIFKQLDGKPGRQAPTLKFTKGSFKPV